MTASLPWLRLYDEVLDDPKVQRLTDAQFRAWVNLLCLANKGKPRGRIELDFGAIAFRLRIKQNEAVDLIEFFQERGFFVDDGWGVKFHDWDERQGRKNRPPAHEWRALREAVFKRDDYTCTYCSARGVRLECDHIVPVALGGTHGMDNLTTACFTCNRSKRDKTLEEWGV